MIGTSASSVSAGVVLRKPSEASQPSMPSRAGRPPPPPIIGSITVTCRRPASGSGSESATMQPWPPLAAGMSSGTARASAPRTAS